MARRNHLSGVYTITCIPTNKIYVGSSTCIGSRWASHKSDLRAGKAANTYLQRAWNKYGSENFNFDVVCKCSANETLKWEQVYMDALQPFGASGFNILKIAGRPTGWSPSPEQRAKRSTRMRTHNHFKGKRHTQETIDRLRASRSYRSIEQVTSDGEIVTVWPSVNAACRSLGIRSKTAIAQVLDKPGRRSGGFEWRTVSHGSENLERAPS